MDTSAPNVKRVGGHGCPFWKSGRRSSGVYMAAPPGRELPKARRANASPRLRPRPRRTSPRAASGGGSGGRRVVGAGQSLGSGSSAPATSSSHELREARLARSRDDNKRPNRRRPRPPRPPPPPPLPSPPLPRRRPRRAPSAAYVSRNTATRRGPRWCSGLRPYAVPRARASCPRRAPSAARPRDGRGSCAFTTRSRRFRASTGHHRVVRVTYIRTRAGSACSTRDLRGAARLHIRSVVIEFAGFAGRVSEVFEVRHPFRRGGAQKAHGRQGPSREREARRRERANLRHQSVAELDPFRGGRLGGGGRRRGALARARARGPAPRAGAHEPRRRPRLLLLQPTAPDATERRRYRGRRARGLLTKSAASPSPPGGGGGGGVSAAKSSLPGGGGGGGRPRAPRARARRARARQSRANRPSEHRPAAENRGLMAV